MRTDTKIQLAAKAYRIASTLRRVAGRGDVGTFRRGGLRWELDLREGIDFSIYLLGGFELSTLRWYRRLLSARTGAVVLDIGANIGAHALPLAGIVGPRGGTVYAFEPTAWACEKLRRNASLNPGLGPSLRIHQTMLVAKDGELPADTTYSSWPLVNAGRNTHPVHGGALRATDGAVAMTLDSFTESNAIANIDLVKLDVDGNEPAVLLGAASILRRTLALVMMEWAPYLVHRDPGPMRQALAMMRDLGYRATAIASTPAIEPSIEALDEWAPGGESANVVLRAEGGV